MSRQGCRRTIFPIVKTESPKKNGVSGAPLAPRDAAVPRQQLLQPLRRDELIDAAVSQLLQLVRVVVGLPVRAGFPIDWVVTARQFIAIDPPASRMIPPRFP